MSLESRSASSFVVASSFLSRCCNASQWARASASTVEAVDDRSSVEPCGSTPAWSIPDRASPLPAFSKFCSCRCTTKHFLVCARRRSEFSASQSRASWMESVRSFFRSSWAFVTDKHGRDDVERSASCSCNTGSLLDFATPPPPRNTTFF